MDRTLKIKEVAEVMTASQATSSECQVEGWRVMPCGDPPTCPRCGCLMMFPTDAGRPHECRGMDAELRSPHFIVDPVLSDQAIDHLARIAAVAPMATLMGRIDFGDEKGNLPKAVMLYSQMLSENPTSPCWFAYREDGERTVATAFTGNGPDSEHAARLYAVARDAVTSLVLHARAKQAEVDELRRRLAAHETASCSKRVPRPMTDFDELEFAPTEDRSSVGKDDGA